MFNLVVAVIGLFFYGEIVKPMEACPEGVSLMPIVPYDYSPRHNHYSAFPVDEKITKKYMAHGVDTIVIDGSKRREKDSGRIKLKLVQIIDDNTSEEVTVQTEKNSISFITVNHNGNYLEIGLHLTDQMPSFVKDVPICIALKKYIKIVTNSHVETTFLSPLQSDELHVKVASGATVQLPSINAKTVELFVEGAASSLNMQENALLKVDDLLCIDRKDSSTIDLAIDTKELKANSNGDGKIILKGAAEQQMLRFLGGSFFAGCVKTKNITIDMVAGKGKIYLCSEGSIRGTQALKSSDYDVTYNVTSPYHITIYPAEPELRWPNKK